jgi:hypothetical protein
MHEVLRARRKDISEEFLRGFNGMTENPIVERQLGWPVATTRMAGWPSRPKHIESAGS